MGLSSAKIKKLKENLQAIKLCTQPVDNHTDPNSISDCWNTVKETLEELESDNLLAKAEQLEKEQQAVCDMVDERINPGQDKAILTGIKRIVDLIRRHQNQ